MAPLRFLLVSTHTDQLTGYSKVSHNLLKQLSTLHPLVKVFHFGFQRAPLQKPTRPIPNIIQYDAAANEMPREQGFGFNKIKEYVETVSPDIIMIYNDHLIINQFLGQLKDVEKTFKLWVYLDQVYEGADMSLLRNIENSVDRIFCFTDSWKKHLLTRLTTPRIPIDVLGHGVDTVTFKPLADNERLSTRKMLNAPPDSILFLNINRNSQRKRLDLTIMGFARLVSRHPDTPYYLTIVTGLKPESGAYYNPLQIYMNELQRLGVDHMKLGNRVSLVDSTPPAVYLPDDAVNQIYNAADIGVNTSNGEGFGLCQLEHMATGAPQVVLDVGGYRSFLTEETAVFVPATEYNYLVQTAGVGIIEHTTTAENVYNGLLAAANMLSQPSTKARCIETAQQFPWSRVCDDFLELVVREKQDAIVNKSA